ncbi:hydrolase TatD [Clostridia bacterium]|nr:hydrolase TatD [Clostridia bacterium]
MIELLNLFDTHAHLDDERFDTDRSDVLRRMVDAGVTRCNCIGADRASSEAAVRLAESHDGLYAVVGIHPQAAAEFSPSDETWLRELSRHPKVVAIGEIGLDYHYDEPIKELQREAFHNQMDWAVKWGKPVQLHIRDAHDEVIDYLRLRKDASPKAVILHCFSGSWDYAKAYLSLGCTISLSGSVTFKNARDLHEVARNVPLDRLLIETDCPYLAPEPKRGKRCEPAFVAHTAARIADLRGIPLEELARATTQNALRVFGISE